MSALEKFDRYFLKQNINHYRQHLCWIKPIFISVLVGILVVGCSQGGYYYKRSFVGQSAQRPFAQPSDISRMEWLQNSETERSTQYGFSIPKLICDPHLAYKNPLDTATAAVPLSTDQSVEVNDHRQKGFAVILVNPLDDLSAQSWVLFRILYRALTDPLLQHPVIFQMSSQPLNAKSEVVRIGMQCQALAVLWEKTSQNSLRLTIPAQPAIPLREDQYLQQHCLFDDRQDRLYALYLSLSSLLALWQADYSKAVQYNHSIKTLRSVCADLTLPPQTPFLP